MFLDITTPYLTLICIFLLKGQVIFWQGGAESCAKGCKQFKRGAQKNNFASEVCTIQKILNTLKMIEELRSTTTRVCWAICNEKF